MRLIIKARDSRLAVEEARRRGFTNVLVVLSPYNDRQNEEQWLEADFDQRRAIDWFTQPPHEAPFPEGTCLWYSVT